MLENNPRKLYIPNKNTNIDTNNIDSRRLQDALSIFSSKIIIDESALSIKENFKMFNEEVFKAKNAQHHIDLCDALQSFEDCVNILPRNSAKTTISSTRYPAWKIGDDRGMRIIIGSHTITASQTLLRSIDNIFLLPRYIEIYGEMRPPMNSDLPWNNTDKIVMNRPEYNKLGFRVDAKESTLSAIGVGGAVVGKRADIIILDDIIDRRTVKTESQINDINHWLTSEVYPIRHRLTQVVISGTRWGAKDVYIKVISDLLNDGAEINGNMIDEIYEQVQKFRELEDKVITSIGV